MDEGEAQQIWDQVSSHRKRMELSVDELEAISGGGRDWTTEGCAATMEPGSDCWGTDYCALWPVTYVHKPVDSICPTCGTYLYLAKVDYETNFEEGLYYRCKNCGYEKKV